MAFPSVDEQLKVLRRGVDEILPEEALVEKLKTSRETDTPLTVKLGCDPSRPDLHLGHTVVLRKLRQFQDLGHQAVLIVGDFTGMIGDPTGRSKTRPKLSLEETRENGRTYYEQAAKVLDPDRTKILYNSEWLDEMSFSEVIELAAQYTVAQMLERDDFAKRYAAGEAIAVHEFLYPLVQAYDSVALRADVELGGTDQRFNLLVGRELQRQEGQAQQVVMTLPLLEGLDGVQKMSKSLGNYVGIDESADSIFGKIMSISDELMWRYFELLSLRPERELEGLREAAGAGRNPRDIKLELAHELAARFHDSAAADAARERFVAQFSQGVDPDEIPEVEVPASDNGAIPIANLLRDAGLTASTSDALRMLAQGAVRIDGDTVPSTKGTL